MWIPQRVKITVDMISKDIKKRKKELIHLLDIGCGEGTMGKLLKEKLGSRISITGCDISSTILKVAQTYYSDVYEVDIESDEFIKKFHKQEFDYVVILEVLEHLFKPENVLKKIYTILKEDGILIASFPNIAWYKYRLDMLRGYFPKNYLLYPGEHIQNFTLYSFRKLLQENSFTPIVIDGQFVFPRIFRPRKIFAPIFKKFPNLFGYQIIVKAKKEKSEKL